MKAPPAVSLDPEGWDLAAEGTARWFGSDALWTFLQAEGEAWKPGIVAPHAITRKTFWWSTEWSPDGEPQPAIAVTGQRLDAPGSFHGGPATIATADFGTAMLVGLEVPEPGCWRVIGTYRGTALSFVVAVTKE